MILDNPNAHNSGTDTPAENNPLTFASLYDKPRNNGDGHPKPPPQEQNSNTQSQETEVNTNIGSENNNNNTNTNDNVVTGNAESDSSSSSSSSSSSNSHSDSSANSNSNSQVGDIDNSSGADATGGNVNISESNLSNFKYYNPSNVFLAPLPPGGDCTEGGSWGFGSIFGGFSKGKSKINEECQAIEDAKFQLNLDLQNKTLDENIALQKEAMQMNLEEQSQQAQIAAEAQDNKLDFDKVKAVCDASVDQAAQARETFNTMDGLETSGAQATVGALAHHEALNSLKLGNMCVTAFGQELGIEETAPELPPLTLPEEE